MVKVLADRRWRWRWSAWWPRSQKSLSKLAEARGSQGLGKNVGQHVLGIQPTKDDGAVLNLFADEMMLDVDVLVALVVHRVDRERDAPVVILVDDGGGGLLEAVVLE